MLTTVLDLLGLFALIAAVLIAASLLFGAVGLACTLTGLGVLALGSSWLIDRVRIVRARK